MLLKKCRWKTADGYCVTHKKDYKSTSVDTIYTTASALREEIVRQKGVSMESREKLEQVNAAITMNFTISPPLC